MSRKAGAGASYYDDDDFDDGYDDEDDYEYDEYDDTVTAAGNTAKVCACLEHTLQRPRVRNRM